MKLYVAGPLFTPGEREFLDRLADRLEAEGHECFVPHRDWRIWRQRDAGITDGALNYFVAGAIEKYGTIVWSVDEVVDVLAAWS